MHLFNKQFGILLAYEVEELCSEDNSNNKVKIILGANKKIQRKAMLLFHFMKVNLYEKERE